MGTYNSHHAEGRDLSKFSMFSMLRFTRLRIFTVFVFNLQKMFFGDPLVWEKIENEQNKTSSTYWTKIDHCFSLLPIEEIDIFEVISFFVETWRKMLLLCFFLRQNGRGQ
jgi:hypothetical protein